MQSITTIHQPFEMGAALTKRGQATIPAVIRRLLRVGPYDRITFHIDPKTHSVTLTPATMILESVFDSVEPLGKDDDFNRISHEARVEHVNKVVSELK